MSTGPWRYAGNWALTISCGEAGLLSIARASAFSLPRLRTGDRKVLARRLPRIGRHTEWHSRNALNWPRWYRSWSRATEALRVPEILIPPFPEILVGPSGL